MPKQTAFWLSDEAIQYLDNFKTEQGLPSRKAALEKIILTHKNQPAQTDQLAHTVVQALEDKYKNMFTRIRLGTNTADINSQVIIEILNSMLISLNIGDKSYMTRTLKSDTVARSEQEIKDKIAYYKQLNDEKKKAK